MTHNTEAYVEVIARYELLPLNKDHYENEDEVIKDLNLINPDLHKFNRDVNEDVSFNIFLEKEGKVNAYLDYFLTEGYGFDYNVDIDVLEESKRAVDKCIESINNIVILGKFKIKVLADDYLNSKEVE